MIGHLQGLHDGRFAACRFRRQAQDVTPLNFRGRSTKQATLIATDTRGCSVSFTWSGPARTGGCHVSVETLPPTEVYTIQAVGVG